MEHKGIIRAVLVLLCFLVSFTLIAQGKYKEAPMLAELVKSGKLPPVDQRLPENPMVGVVAVSEDELKPEIGKYGGTLRLIDWQSRQIGHDAGWIQREYMLDGSYQMILEKIYPNAFEKFAISPDSKVYTFYMRKGMKWSDGKPFTTDDIDFWYRGILLNEKLTSTFDNLYRAKGLPTGEKMKLDILDNYTFRITFAEKYPMFLQNYRVNVGADYYPPKHFFAQFHPDYTPLEKLEPLIKKEGFEKGEWWRLFNVIRERGRSTAEGEYDIPTLSPYILTQMTNTRATLERNPYYWKVDKAGNQLPYIDRLEVGIVATPDAAALKIISGEVDFSRQAVGGVLKNVPMYQEYAEKAGYKVIMGVTSHVSPCEVEFNLTNEDPVWRKVVQDIRFRQAVSLAVDRQKVNEVVYAGLAGPPRTIPIEGYNPAKANQLLDEMGLNKRDAEGFRLGPDGKRFLIPFELHDVNGGEVATAEVVTRELAKVGLYATVKKVDNQYWRQLASANKLFAFVNWMGYVTWPFPGQHFIGDEGWGAGTYGLLWRRWYNTRNDPKPVGEKAPEAYIKMRNLLEQLEDTTDAKKQSALWGEVKRILTENVWWIPMADDLKYPYIASKKLGNVPEKGTAFWMGASAEQFFYK